MNQEIILGASFQTTRIQFLFGLLEPQCTIHMKTEWSQELYWPELLSILAPA